MEKRHLDVVRYYMRGYKKADCLRMAGYSESLATTDAESIFNRPDVAAEIKKRTDNMMKRNEITEDWIVQRLMNIADASIGDLIEVDKDGNPSLDMSKLNPTLRNALAGFEIEKYMKGRGENAREATKIKVKMSDKIRALELLGKYFGMFKEKVQVSGDDSLIALLQRGRARAGGYEQPE